MSQVPVVPSCAAEFMPCILAQSSMMGPHPGPSLLLLDIQQNVTHLQAASLVSSLQRERNSKGGVEETRAWESYVTAALWVPDPHMTAATPAQGLSCGRVGRL